MSRNLVLPPEMERALLAAYDDVPHGARVEARRRGKKETKAVSEAKPMDGRRLRATGRTAQLNVAVKPDVKAAVVKAAHKAGVPMTVFVERALLAAVEAMQ